MNTKYAVKLSEAERARLRMVIGHGTAPARQLTRARILLKANQGEGGPGWADVAIAGAVDVHLATGARVRREHGTGGGGGGPERQPAYRGHSARSVCRGDASWEA